MALRDVDNALAVYRTDQDRRVALDADVAAGPPPRRRARHT
jgi:multidrug efflux system outer membrane protein